MKIRLINFLCYKDTIFDLGEDGMVLISGPSGCGKTSIIKGIFFALFGDGTKVQMSGCSSCKAELFFKHFKITRTKRPNRLILFNEEIDKVYEDAVAQEIINSKFGKNFKTCGYISQNNISSFILMSPSDKLEFLEQCTFEDIDLAKIRERCKSHIQKANDELIRTRSKKNTIEEIYNTKSVPEEIPFPIKCKSSQQDIAFKNETIYLKRCKRELEKLTAKEITIQNTLHNFEVFKAKRDSYLDQLGDKDTKLLQLREEALEISFSEQLQSQLQQDELCLEEMVINREYITLEKQYQQDSEHLQELRVSELEKLSDELIKLEKNLWSEYTQTELTDILSDNKECLQDIKRMTELRHISAKLKDEIKILKLLDESELSNKLSELRTNLHNSQMALKTYPCPNCNTDLFLGGNGLEISCCDRSQEPSDIEYLETEVAKYENLERQNNRDLAIKKSKTQELNESNIELESLLEKYEDIPTVDEIESQNKYLNYYAQKQKENSSKTQSLKSKIENEDLSDTYRHCYRKLDVLKNKLNNSKPKHTITTDLSESDLRDRINKMKLDQGRAEIIKNNINKLEEEYFIIENKVSVLTSEFMSHNKVETIDLSKISEKCRDELQEIQDNIKDQKLLQERHIDNISKIEKWKENDRIKKEHLKMMEDLEEIKSQEIEAGNKYTGTLKLKEKIAEAESISMTNTVETINTYAQSYLDHFFSEEPITIILQTFKETKKSTKPSINVSVKYKGMDCELGMLSGGELSRIVLAYTLALSDMFNTPLVLLDECTASLDQDLTETVFENIKESINNKLVVIIAHQVVSGAFDKVISLKD